MGQESWHFPCLSLHSKWRSNVLLLLQPIFQVQRLYLLLSSAVVAIFWTSCILLSSVKAIPDVYQCSVLMHFASVLDKHPLSERLRLCFGEAKSEISRWVLIFQDELRHKSIHTKDTRHWKWWKLLLMPSNVCAIPEYPSLLALYLDTREDRRSCFLKIKLISDYNINAIMSFQCWWWWEYEILMVKDFTTRPQIRFWELKLSKQLMKNWWHFFLPYTIKYFDMLFSPRCLWVERFLMCSQQFLTGVWVSSPTKENTTWWQLLVVIPQDIIEIGNVDL